MLDIYDEIEVMLSKHIESNVSAGCQPQLPGCKTSVVVQICRANRFKVAMGETESVSTE